MISLDSVSEEPVAILNECLYQSNKIPYTIVLHSLTVDQYYRVLYDHPLIIKIFANFPVICKLANSSICVQIIKCIQHTVRFPVLILLVSHGSQASKYRHRPSLPPSASYYKANVLINFILDPTGFNH